MTSINEFYQFESNFDDSVFPRVEYQRMKMACDNLVKDADQISSKLERKKATVEREADTRQ